jgi:retron-type reverse transcriptase
MTAYAGRRYNFQRHGWSEYHWLRRRRHRQAPTSANGIPTLDTTTLDDVVHHERLLEAFDELRREGGQAPGIDRRTFSDYSRSEIADVLRGVARSIREGTYRPQPARPVPIPKADGGWRVLRIRTVVDRTVGKALARALTPLIDPLFAETSFGFRPGRSHLNMLAALEALMIATDSWVLAVDDIRQAFDNVPIEFSVSNYRNLIADSALVNLIDVVLRGHDGAHRERGTDQGCPFSPLNLNVLLNDILDRPLLADRDTPSQHRYADNVAFVCREVPEGERALQQVREALQVHGLELKGQDGPPVDLTRNGTQASLFRFRISKPNDRLRYELEDQTWQDLRDGLGEAHLNDKPGEIARLVTRGWILGHAPALVTDAEVVLRRIRWALRGTGLQYEVPEVLLRDSIREAGAQWERLRSQALRSLLEPQQDPSWRSAPRAVHQPEASWEHEAAEADDSVLPSNAVDAELSAPFDP